jgi:DNA helicase IV
VPTHPELTSEQAYIDQAYERLAAMRESVAERLVAALRENKGTPQAIHEREIVVQSALHRIDQLDIGDEALTFGRIDVASASEHVDDGVRGRSPRVIDEAASEDEHYYIGRLAVSAADQEPLVVDWRAPIAEPFYRATPREPMGLRRRRHFLAEGRQLHGIEDEIFSLGEGDSDDDAVAGSSALLAALERSRSGRMRDIVATVQREQDEVIRAPLHGVLVVQGGPGTGKTAVALHRAAYLLYTHRFPLERQGVLVVGPNPVFLRYIDHVLPSLGESGVVLASITGIAGGPPVSGVDSAEAARVKGDARMVKVIARAIRDRQRPLRETAIIPFGTRLLRLTAPDSAALVSTVKRRAGTHNARRRQLETLVIRKLISQLGESATADHDELNDQLRGVPAFSEAMDRMWPALIPEELLHDLYGAPALIKSAAGDTLTESEQRALRRERVGRFEDIPWTTADIALLDEARGALGPRRRKDTDPIRGFGHVVVDEAQDLSPMQLRVLARRSLSGSMTVVGDIAQATGTWAPRSWDAVLEHLPTGREGARVTELSVNYRTPAEVMNVAARVLEAAAPGMSAPRSVRETGVAPTFAAVPAADVAFDVARAARRFHEEFPAGTVAIVAPASMVAELSRDLRSTEIPFGEPATHGLDAPITLVGVDVVKGLEFDGVVVVEPSRIVAESPQGLRALFVALTRPTQRLAVIHSEPLPEPLVSA